MPELIINGESVHAPDGLTVADLLRDRQLDRLACAVEVNRKVVPKRQHADHTLRDGDRVEIVTLVGGG
jgi:thiamine biosynthesis protein ThiS